MSFKFYYLFCCPKLGLRAMYKGILCRHYKTCLFTFIWKLWDNFVFSESANWSQARNVPSASSLGSSRGRGQWGSLVITRAGVWEPRIVLSSWWNMNTASWYFLTGIVSWNNFANNNDANWCGNIDVCYYLWIGLLLLLRILRFIQGPFRTRVLG